MPIFVKIYELKKQGFKKLQTAKILNIDVKTVRKYWDMTEKDYLNYANDCKQRSRIMAAYDNFIIDKLKRFPDVTAAQIYDWLREAFAEFTPSSSTVRLHVRQLREREGIPKTGYLRQYEAVDELPFGRQAQVDMGSDWLLDNYGKRIKVYVFAMVMASKSRHKFVFFQRNPFNTDDFIQAHRLAFEFFGGRTQEIVYDQDRVMCVSENAGNILLTEKFLAFQIYCGFRVYLCRAADPESKGKIEAAVKYVKNNFLRHRIFCGIDALNSQAVDWLDRTGNGLAHETTKLIPKIVFKEEQKYLIPVPSAMDDYKPSTYLVRKDNVISYRSNRYALPLGTYLPGKQVFVKEIEDSLIISDEKGAEIIKHPLCRQRGKLIPIYHPERTAYVKHKQLFDEVLALFGGADEIEKYLKRNTEVCPRYLRDQFIIFKKCAQTYKPADIKRALEYCIEKELFYANEFKDTLVYFENLQPETFVPDQFQIPLKYAVITAEQRDISNYCKIYGGIIK